MPVLLPSGLFQRSKGCWSQFSGELPVRSARRQGRAINLGDTKRNFAGYGLPALVTRSPAQG
jgi:hypothetical protein